MGKLKCNNYNFAMKYKIFLYHIYIYVYNDFRNLVSRKETSDWVFRGSNFLLLLADE